MKVFSTDGTALSTIASPSNSISPWANVQYHDLSTPPTAVVGEDSDGQTVEWDGSSNSPCHTAWATPWRSNGLACLSLDPTWSVDGYGTVHVHGTGKANFEIVDVRRTFHVVPPAVDNLEQLTAKPCFVATSCGGV